jgi:uncharacterized protein
MKPPLITATYVATLALLYAVLSLQVLRLRRRNRVGFGDGENAALRCAIRAHAHFAEYVPIIALMAAMLEMSGLAATRIHMLARFSLRDSSIRSGSMPSRGRCNSVSVGWVAW